MLREMIILKVKGVEVPIEIKRFHNSKSLRIFGTGNNIRVTTNNLVSKKRVAEIVQENRDIIYSNYVEGIQEELAQEAKIENFEFYFYLEGQKFNLIIREVKESKSRAFLQNRDVVVEVAQEATGKLVNKLLRDLQEQMAQTYLPLHFEHDLQCFSYETKPQIVVKKMIRQWGNCKKNRPLITLNSHLIKLPSELIHYVVFHELTHLIHLNHGKEFYKIIEHRFPHRKELDKRLKRWSFVLKDDLTEELK